MAGGAGRFAPSPTGPLHFGSLLTATASWLDARARGDAWYVRMDDLDAARVRPGAASAILADLETHGLCWDGPVRYQSTRISCYEAALADLAELDCLFYCACSRSTLTPVRIYPGTCRSQRAARPDCAVRMQVGDSIVHFDDLLQGRRHAHLAQIIGDFVVRRRDSIIAYPLATAVDDGSGDISRVIRGRDLLAGTPAQLLVMDRLGLARPTYGHLPLMINRAGQKLSKQTHAKPLDARRPLDNLRLVLHALGSPAAADPAEACADLLEAARRPWSLDHIPPADHVAPS